MAALTHHLSPHEHPRTAVVVAAVLAVVAVTAPVAMFFADDPGLRWPVAAAVAGLVALAIADLRWEGGDAIRLVAFTGVVFAVPAALLPFVPEQSVAISRLAGADRSATAVAVSRHVHDDAAAVVVVDPRSAGDAVVAAPLAAHLGVPLLFTGGNLRGEVERLGAGTAYLVGTAAAGGAGTRLQRDGLDRVVRLAGDDLHATTAAVVGRIDPDVVYVAASTADAVAVAPALGEGVGLVLVGPDGVPAPIRRHLGRLDPDELVVVGGEAALPASVVDELRRTVPGARVARELGADRWSGALAVQDGPDGEPGPVWLASGDSWPDALVAGVGAAAEDEPLLLVSGTRTTVAMSATLRWLERHGGEVGDVTVVGGEGAVPEDVLQRIVG